MINFYLAIICSSGRSRVTRCRRSKRKEMTCYFTNRAGQNTSKRRDDMLIPMIDYFSFGVLQDDYIKNITPLLEELKMKKEKAKEHQINKASEKTVITINDLTFEVLANGANGYAFILHNSEYQVQLMQYETTNKSFYPVKVYIKAEALWSMNPYRAYNFIYCWLEKSFGKIKCTKVSRVDLCCHIDIIDFDYSYVNNFKGSYKKTNVRSDNRKFSGIEFGVRESKVYCRIYNKKLEVDTKRNKLCYYDQWKNNGWNGKSVWNVEFEIKRDFFY